MKLVLEDYKSITLGCAAVTEENGKIRFHRFTEKEELFYKERDKELNTRFSNRCAAPAGIRLRFATESKTLKIAVTVASTTSRSYFSFDVFENGKLLGYLDNFREDELIENYTEQQFPLGRHEKSFILSAFLPPNTILVRDHTALQVQ